MRRTVPLLILVALFFLPSGYDPRLTMLGCALAVILALPRD